MESIFVEMHIDYGKGFEYNILLAFRKCKRVN